MNKIILAVVFCLAASISVKLQTASEADKAALEQLNQRVIEAANAGKLNDAEDLARRALEQAIRLFGNDSEDTAVAFFNLGEVYRAKKDYVKAVDNLFPALVFYQKDKDKFAQKIANTAQSLGIAFGYARNLTSAEKYLSMAVAAAEEFYGKENKGILPFLTNLRNFYVFTGDFNKAELKFVDNYLLASKILDPGSEELAKIEDDYVCFAVTAYPYVAAQQRVKGFRDAIGKPYNLQNPRASDLSDKTSERLASGFVNSMAVILKKPSYPPKAGKKRIGGMIPVKIIIDESGKVVEAKTFCGNEDLRKSSEKAALKSKFPAGITDGKPTKVLGYVLYNFVIP